MTNFELMLKAWDSAHWELGEAFKGLADEDVWRRPHERLLSIGEIATHLGYWESDNFSGGQIETLLHDPAGRYYSNSVAMDPLVLPIGAEALYQELQRIHGLAKAAFLAEPRNHEDPSPYREGWTWGSVLEYTVFHVAYHTGQIYSIRHLMGHETVDN